MEDDKKEKTPQPLMIYYQPPPYQDDEISLVDLWRVLVRRWQWIAGSLILVVAAAAVYLLNVIPIYEAEAVLLPPEERHVQLLNISGVSAPGRKELYQELVANLKSSSLRRRFFDDNNLLTIMADENAIAAGLVFQSFNESLQVRDGGNQGDLVYVSMQGSKPEQITAWINDFIDLAARYTIESILEGMAIKIQNEKNKINEDIRIDREFAQQRRLDYLAVLDESISIARALNIISRDNKSFRVLEGNSLGIAVTTSGEPIYARGVKDLTAEKEALKSRKELDPFIPGLRDKQARLEALDSQLRLLQTTPKSEVAPAQIDQPAVVPESPVQTRKKMVMALSLVLGAMLGIFAAFFAEFLHNARKEQK